LDDEPERHRTSDSYPRISGIVPARLALTVNYLGRLVYKNNKSLTQAFDYEEALIACACGDHDALLALYDRDARWLMGVILRIVRDHHLAEDVLQEAFLQVWQRANTFNSSRGSGRGWIYTVVRHRALDARRGVHLEVNTDSRDLENLANRQQAADLLPTGLGSMDLEHCINQLEPVKRDCIIQAFVEGLTHEQIALRLNAPLGTVKARTSWVAIAQGLSLVNLPAASLPSCR